MHKLIILIRRPPDVAEFDARWSEDFVPLAEKMPGIRRVAVSRVRGGPSGQVDVHLVHEFYFDDRESLQAALTSPAGQSAGRALMSFAAEYATLCFAEHMEEDRR